MYGTSLYYIMSIRMPASWGSLWEFPVLLAGCILFYIVITGRPIVWICDLFERESPSFIQHLIFGLVSTFLPLYLIIWYYMSGSLMLNPSAMHSLVYFLYFVMCMVFLSQLKSDYWDWMRDIKISLTTTVFNLFLLYPAVNIICSIGRNLLIRGHGY